MATYTHFAKQPDVLKHLILCEVLRNEAPQVYVETNSACAIYSMTQTPETFVQTARIRMNNKCLLIVYTLRFNYMK